MNLIESHFDIFISYLGKTFFIKGANASYFNIEISPERNKLRECDLIKLKLIKFSTLWRRSDKYISIN